MTIGELKDIIQNMDDSGSVQVCTGGPLESITHYEVYDGDLELFG